MIIGHINPDEDCIASMVAMAILAKKLSKNVYMLIADKVHERFQYLINICKFNSINIITDCKDLKKEIEAVFIMDTPKPSMVEKCKEANKLMKNKDIVKVEIDHHLSSDSQYIGDPDYRLVTEASSASELVGYLALKLQKKASLLEIFDIDDLFSRNFVLAVLTGIVGDSKMGKYIKSHREKWYFELFSNRFSDLLNKKTDKASLNLSSMEEVFNEISKLSKMEEKCFNFFAQRKKLSKYFGYAVLNENDMNGIPNNIDTETIVSTARAVADDLAEDSGYLSLVVYYDKPSISDLIQFRIRRSHRFKTLDLRKVLDTLQIENGGGHEGAIGFRVEKKNIENLEKYTQEIISKIIPLIEDVA